MYIQKYQTSRELNYIKSPPLYPNYSTYCKSSCFIEVISDPILLDELAAHRFRDKKRPSVALVTVWGIDNSGSFINKN